MAENIVALKQRAKRAGISGYRGMTHSELVAALNGQGSKPSKKRVVKKAVRKAPVKKATNSKKTTRKATKKVAAKRGRPPKAKTTAKRTTAKRVSNDNGGRNLIARANFSKTEGWNPREGGIRHTIFLALKKAKGDRDKAFSALLPSIKELVPATEATTGNRRTKQERESYLRYLINRVLFDFVRQTGQHEVSTNRAVYGEGGTGEGKFKRGKAQGGRQARNKPKAAAKSTRKPAKAQKGSQSRAGGARKSTKRGPGRPKGSKNRSRK